MGARLLSLARLEALTLRRARALGALGACVLYGLASYKPMARPGSVG
jgi:hypothetical protein